MITIWRRLYTGIILPIILVAVGVLLLVVGISNIGKRKTMAETDALIRHIESRITGTDEYGNEEYDYTVTVQYTVDGREYVGDLGEYDSSMREGDTIRIKYVPADPTDIQSGSSLGVIMTIVFGSLSIIFGLGMFLKKLLFGFAVIGA